MSLLYGMNDWFAPIGELSTFSSCLDIINRVRVHVTSQWMFQYIITDNYENVDDDDENCNLI